MSGRRTDFSEFVAARRSELRRLAFALSGDWHTADDIVQTALSRLYRAWPRVHAAAAEMTYARRAVVRAAIDESRRPWRREWSTDSVPDVPMTSHGDRTSEVAIVLDEAIATLPAQQRRVVVLRYWLGLSVAETATATGISQGTVKSQSSRALDKLRPLMSSQIERTRR